MRAVPVRGKRFNGRQPSGLNFDCRMSRLVEGGGASVRDKNTLAGLCAKIAGGAYARGGGGVFAGHYGKSSLPTLELK